jgi:hypothetical protein
MPVDSGPDKAKAATTKSGRTSKPSLKRRAADVLKAIISKRLKRKKTVTTTEDPATKDGDVLKLNSKG